MSTGNRSKLDHTFVYAALKANGGWMGAKTTSAVYTVARQYPERFRIVGSRMSGVVAIFPRLPVARKVQ